jgi:hypothetical protein
MACLTLIIPMEYIRPQPGSIEFHCLFFYKHVTSLRSVYLLALNMSFFAGTGFSQVQKFF